MDGKTGKSGDSMNGKYAYRALPSNYDLYMRIDLTKDRKALKMLTVWTLVIAAGMVIPMAFKHSLKPALAMPTSELVMCILLMCLGLMAYIVAHEAVHGIFIRLFTGEAPDFGIEWKKGMAYAGSTWLFKQIPYVVIALAPLVFWGIVLAVAIVLSPEKYFWFIYAVQIFNVTGASGDIYVTIATIGMPGDVLVSDSGTGMNYYLDRNID